MRYLQPLKAAMATGSVVGLWHLVWAALVGLGWAKPLLDFILHLHFIAVRYELAPFTVTTAALLVAVTFSIGFLFGLAFAAIWNWLGAAPAVPKDESLYAPRLM